jgi:phosphate:Na+ symporter
MNLSSLYNILEIVGALVIFLIGMKLMSEALQKVAGVKMRSVFGALTSNKLRSITTGFILTGALQSSSAVTVMIVSFVNAGLLALPGAIAVIMGANIGTTLTAWLVAIAGFKLNIAAFSLPLIGLSFPLYFSGNSKRKIWGEILVGFALLFLGLQFMKELIPNIESSELVIQYLENLTNKGYLSILIFFIIGIIITAVMQSSSAVMALTLVLAFEGSINFELAAAMILGENIGTTITANIAAIVANKNGKTAARAHLIFNSIGAAWVLIIFAPFLEFIDFFFESLDFNASKLNIINIDSTSRELSNIPIKLSIFHTVFNVLNTAILAWFIPQIQKISKAIVISKSFKNEDNLAHIDSGLLSTSEVSIVQAKNELSTFANKISTMMSMIPKLLLEKKEDSYNNIYKTIMTYEDLTNTMETEIGNYIGLISEKDLSHRGSQRIRSMLKITDELESIADRITSLAHIIDSKNKQNAWFTQEQRDRIKELESVINNAIINMQQNLDLDAAQVTLDKAIELETQINTLRDKLLEDNIKMVNDNKYPYISGSYYSNIISTYEKIGDHILNVNEAIYMPFNKSTK